MNPGEFLSALGWRDVLDFSLLFLTFYGTLRIVRGTLALPVLVVVALIAASGQVARALQLVGVAQVITYFLQYAILILLVVVTLLIALGCHTAMNLDGGSSKRMVIGDRAVDLPSTEVVGGGGERRPARVRPVHTALLFLPPGADHGAGG